MPDFETLKKKYFNTDDLAPEIYEGCKVTPLIDGEAYFNELATAIDLVGKGKSIEENSRDFIYIAGWGIDLLSRALFAGASAGTDDGLSFVVCAVSCFFASLFEANGLDGAQLPSISPIR